MSLRDRLLGTTIPTGHGFSPEPAVTNAVAHLSAGDLGRVLAEMEGFVAGLNDRPVPPLAFTFSVSATLPQGYCSFTRMEGGEMKVVWTGRLAEVTDWPSGAKLWLHRDDYDLLCAKVPER